MNTFFNSPLSLNIKGKLIRLETPLVMGILNVTPDSFFGNSRISSVQQAVDTAARFITEGATILDIGAYSSRPGAEDISAQEEMDRLIPVIQAIISTHPDAILSADTYRAKVAEAAVHAGASIINDISGGTLDAQMFETVAKLKVPYVLMHMRGTPQNMNSQTKYDDLLGEIIRFFTDKIYQLKQLGVQDIIIDPGFGFAKTAEQSFSLLRQMETFKIFELPVLAGFSRKSMIYKTLGITPEEALNGTTVLNTIALQKGAAILRVHDVRAATECIRLITKINQA